MSMIDMPVKRAIRLVKEGFRAGSRADSSVQCPYPTGSPEAEMWEMGFIEGLADAENKNN